MTSESSEGSGGAPAREIEPPPESWEPIHKAARTLVEPIERFLHIQASSGVVLLVSALVALAWANSPWRESYHHFWHAQITLGFGDLVFQKSLHFWINDALMVVFFFVVGLEIRREIHSGELSDPKRAALPVAAACGGMAVPALVFLAFNFAIAGNRGGWGVPMATDIAFAVGILALLGKRVPAALRVLLLALAIIDDIGAILVIALFYSSGVELGWLAVAAVGIAAIVILQRLGLRHVAVYLPAALVLWVGMLRAGVHPTIAGVILGLMTPARAWFGEREFMREVRRAVGEFRRRRASDQNDEHDLVKPLERLKRARKEALPPDVRMESAFHPWVAYLVMPLFALANAGVTLGDVELGAAGAAPLVAGIGIGLAVGKPLGIVVVSLLAVRLGLAELPRGVDARGLWVVGFVSGIGFTMALFIATLAFAGDPARLGVAKLSILAGSGLAGLAGVAVGLSSLPASPRADAARSAARAEKSTAV